MNDTFDFVWDEQSNVFCHMILCSDEAGCIYTQMYICSSDQSNLRRECNERKI